jgi:hypothetical protein
MIDQNRYWLFRKVGTAHAELIYKAQPGGEPQPRDGRSSVRKDSHRVGNGYAFSFLHIIAAVFVHKFHGVEIVRVAHI